MSKDDSRVIYSLTDPNGLARWVGCTTNTRRRLCSHMSQRKREPASQKTLWLDSLEILGLMPTLMVLETGVTWDTWLEAESRWIATLRAKGHPLLNISTGGRGARGMKWTPWPAINASAVARAGKPQPPDLVARRTKHQRAKSVMVDGVESWRCRRCGHVKPTKEFTALTSNWNGIKQLCKACNREVVYACKRKAEAR